MNRSIVALVAVCIGVACADEELQTLSPAISICPAADSAPDACDRTISLGEAPLGIATTVEVFIVNRGDGRLFIDDTSVDVEVIEVLGRPDDVSAGTAEPLPLQITAADLGAHVATLTVASSDRERSPLSVPLTFIGVPPPQPDIVVCDGDADDATCVPTDLVVDLGSVRPTQAASALVVVQNVGDTDLAIEGARLEGDAELRLASSAQSGSIAAGEAASIVVVYEPTGPGTHEATLTIVSDDADTPEAVVVVRGESAANDPPIAVCAESVGGGQSATVRVDDLVGIEGSASSDPEGDPLVFTWTLEVPAGSTALVDDPAAANALFEPDVRGAYNVSLVVTDSIGQASAPCDVTIDATARFGFRARLAWGTGGDVDVHLVESGSAPFSARDAYFDNRSVPAGDSASALDDALLLDDATAGPGEENAVIEVPAAGTWQVWVHFFDDADLGAVTVGAELVLDDTAPAAFAASLALSNECDLWHVADVTFPGGAVNPAGTTVVSQCP